MFNLKAKLINELQSHPALLIILTGVLITAAIWDYRTQKIPNRLNGVALVAAVTTWSWLGGWSGFFFSFKGLWAGLATLIIPYALGVMGGGDVKLMAVVGAFLGVQGALNAVILTSLCGGVYAIGLIALHPRQCRAALQRHWITFKLLLATKTFMPDPPDKKAPRLFYGIAISAGTLLYVALGMAGVKPIIEVVL